MTETHKAAVEALEAMPSNRIYGGIKSATQFKKELGEWAFNNLDALRTLKQPSSVEVTDDDFEQFCKWAKSRGYKMDRHPLHQLFLNSDTYHARQGWNAVKSITRAAATDGVKS